MLELEALGKDRLLELVHLRGRNWLTIDGLWIQAVEKAYGTEVCLRMYTSVMEQFQRISARRIARFLGIPQGKASLSSMLEAHKITGGGVEAAYAKTSDREAVVSFLNCRPQQGRIEKGQAIFPCKEMELAGMSSFFEELNPKARVDCLYCPPNTRPKDLPQAVSCQWKLTIRD